MKKLSILFLIGSFACGGENVESNQQAIEADCEPSDPNAYRFDKAICLCGDLQKVGRGITASSYSSFGNNASTAGRGDVGVNGAVSEVGHFDVGSLYVGGEARGVGHLDIERDLEVGWNLATQGHITVGGDVTVDGDYSARGTTTIGGTLAVSGAISQQGRLVCEEVQEGVAVDVELPCPCQSETFLDVAAEVAANAAATPLPIGDQRGQQTVRLTEGRYYSAEGGVLHGKTQLVIEGAVQLYIDDDIELFGRSFIELTEGAQLDIYVAGSISKFGNFTIASATGAPASRAVRLYVGGEGTAEIELVGKTVFEGAIYAPKADLFTRGNLTVRGAIFANNLEGRGRMEVYYDAGLVGDGEECDDPTTDDPTGELDPANPTTGTGTPNDGEGQPGEGADPTDPSNGAGSGEGQPSGNGGPSSGDGSDGQPTSGTGEGDGTSTGGETDCTGDDLSPDCL